MCQGLVKTLFVLASAVMPLGQADPAIFKCKTPAGIAYQKSLCAAGDERMKFSTTQEKTGRVVPKSLSLKQSGSGHYFLASKVNGVAVTFVVDTGASYVSLPKPLADQAKLTCAKAITLQTANGLAQGCATVIDTLKIGDFLIHDVDALIVPNLAQPLLGMNVLQRFNVSQDGRRMRLTER